MVGITTFRVSKNIVRLFREHCRALSRGVGVCLEEAMLDYMLGNPVANRTYLIQRKIREAAPDRRREIKVKVLSREIRRHIRILDSMRRAGIEERRDEYEGQLLNLLLRASDVPDTSDEFTELLEEAYSYLE